MPSSPQRKSAELFSEISAKPFLIAGPCALETEAVTLGIAAHLKTIAVEFDIPVIFKGSYSKANRTRQDSYHGLGLEAGLDQLSTVKREYGLPVTADVHEVQEVDKAADVLDIIQIPALLCKNTRLLHAVGDTSGIINIKKGHFVTAADMSYSVEKISIRGNSRILLTERGNLYGYSDTIVDFRSIETLKSFGYPVVFDATHSVRNPSRRSEEKEGGTPQAIPLLIRCAAAAGSDGLFIETHSSPEETLCDSIVCYPLERLSTLVDTFVKLHNFVSCTA